MLKDHGVPLRTKHEGDNYEPAGELPNDFIRITINPFNLPCVSFFNTFSQSDHAGVEKIDIQKH
jgi:hypothetical protein